MSSCKAPKVPSLRMSATNTSFTVARYSLPSRMASPCAPARLATVTGAPSARPSPLASLSISTSPWSRRLTYTVPSGATAMMRIFFRPVANADTENPAGAFTAAIRAGVASTLSGLTMAVAIATRVPSPCWAKPGMDVAASARVVKSEGKRIGDPFRRQSVTSKT